MTFKALHNPNVTGEGLSLGQVCFRLAGSVWVLDFMQERSHNASPGDFESIFVRAGDGETQEGLSVEEATGEPLGSALLWLPRNVTGKMRAVAGCCQLTAKSEKRGLWRQVQGVSLGRAATACCSPARKSQ